MSQDRIEQIARAVMFEGYMLYPYRPSIKNTQRWTFGAVFPRDWCAAQEGAESFCMQVECLVLAEPTATFEVAANCLQIVSRSVAELVRPAAWLPQGQEPAHMEVDVLRIGDRTLRPWQEAFERAVICGPLALREILDQPRIVSFEFPAERTTEPQRNAAGTIVGLVIRQQETIRGELEISASATETGGPVILRVVLRNLTGVESPAQTTRDAALKSAAVSTHFILRAHEGEFISAIDPPPRWMHLIERLHQVGCWPVLVGEPISRDAVLAAPIILYDYPQIAAESPGDFFDSAEIDEMLALRISTLTDEEKNAMASIDDRAKALLHRTQSMAEQQMQRLHGRSEFSPSRIMAEQSDEATPPPSRPSARSQPPIRPGDRVRLHPRGRADAFDMLLDGRCATVAAVEIDFENHVHLAVTIDDDPGADLGRDRKIAHRFFFRPDEVEPIGASSGVDA